MTINRKLKKEKLLSNLEKIKDFHQIVFKIIYVDEKHYSLCSLALFAALKMDVMKIIEAYTQLRRISQGGYCFVHFMSVWSKPVLHEIKVF